MELVDAGVCRTCFSPREKLIEMSQTVPNLEKMTYSDILDFCQNLQKTMEGKKQRAIKYPSHICLRCSKALEVSYHFLKMVQNTNRTLEEEQQAQLNINDEVEEKRVKRDHTLECEIVVAIENEEILPQEQHLSINQDMAKPLDVIEPDTALNGMEEDIQSIEEIHCSKIFSDNISPSKDLWNNSVIKSDLNSLTELKDSDWIDKIASDGIIGNYRNREESTDDSDTVDSGSSKTECIDANIPSDNLPNNIPATQVNVPHVNQLTKDFQKKNSISKFHAVKNAESLAKLMLSDFVDDLDDDMDDDDSDMSSEITPNQVELPTDTNENLFCKMCNENFTDKNDYTRHMKTHKDCFITASHSCPDCGRKYRNHRGMRHHFMRSHAPPKVKPVPGSYPCPLCARVFRFNHNLLRHQRTCDGTRDFQCHLCDKKYDTMRQLEVHLSKEHGVEKIHQCSICDKTFKNFNYLIAHQKRHTERNFQCQQCPKAYANKAELRIHNDRIHGTEIKGRCAICDATFTSSIDLRIHQSRFHFKKQHVCSQCGYIATTVSRLKLHQYKHLGMPYRCTKCDKGFALRIFMRRHAKAAHKMNLSDIDLAEMFRKNMGYPSRYDVFSNTEYSLELPEVLEEDIEQELTEFGLNFNDIMQDLFNEKEVNLNI